MFSAKFAKERPHMECCSDKKSGMFSGDIGMWKSRWIVSAQQTYTEAFKTATNYFTASQNSHMKKLKK